jgi:hypothetical protein
MLMNTRPERLHGGHDQEDGEDCERTDRNFLQHVISPVKVAAAKLA